MGSFRRSEPRRRPPGMPARSLGCASTAILRPRPVAQDVAEHPGPWSPKTQTMPRRSRQPPPLERRAPASLDDRDLEREPARVPAGRAGAQFPRDALDLVAQRAPAGIASRRQRLFLGILRPGIGDGDSDPGRGFVACGFGSVRIDRSHSVSGKGRHREKNIPCRLPTGVPGATGTAIACPSLNLTVIAFRRAIGRRPHVQRLIALSGGVSDV